MDAEEQNAVIRGVAIVFACGRRTRGGAQGEMRSGERVSRRGVRAGTFCTWRANENIRNSSRAAPNPRTHPRVMGKCRHAAWHRPITLDGPPGAIWVPQALLGPLIIEIIDVEETEEYNLVIPFQH